MSDQPGPASSPITPGIATKISFSVFSVGLVLGFGLLSINLLRSKAAVNSPAGIAGFEIFVGLMVLGIVAYLLRSAFAWVQVTSQEVLCKSPLGTRRIPIRDIDFAEFYYSKNGPNLTVFAGRRRFLLLGLGFSEGALRTIQSEILRAGTAMSKQIASHRPQPSDKEVATLMSMYGLLVVFGGLGLLFYVVYRAHRHF